MSYDDWLARETASNDPGRLRDDQEREPIECCDVCGEPLHYFATRIGGVGQFCDRLVRPECALAGVKKHEQQQRRTA